MKRPLTAHIANATRGSRIRRGDFLSRHVLTVLVTFSLATAGLTLPSIEGRAAAAGRRSTDGEGGNDPASKLIEQGIGRRKVDDWEGARTLFDRAYEMSHSPRAAAHLGVAEVKLALFVEAEAHLSEALKATGNEWIESHRADLTESLRSVRAHLGRLEVVGRPAGAEVEVAGKTVGRLPLSGPLRVTAGEVYVRVSADGFVPDRKAVTVPAGELFRYVADLEALPSSGTPARARPTAHDENPLGRPPPPEDGKPRKKSSVAASATDSAPGRRSADADWHVPAGWIAAGTAGVFAVGGIAALLIHANRIDSFNNTKLNDVKRCSTRFGDNGGGPCSGLLNDANLAKTLAIGSFVGAGIAAGAAVLFFATAPAADEDEGDYAFACAPTIGITGATCHWRF